MCYIYVCVIYIYQHTLRHTPGLKGPLSHAYVAYSKNSVFSPSAKHFGNTFINIVGFPVYVDIKGNVISTVLIGITE